MCDGYGQCAHCRCLLMNVSTWATAFPDDPTHDLPLKPPPPAPPCCPHAYHTARCANADNVFISTHLSLLLAFLSVRWLSMASNEHASEHKLVSAMICWPVRGPTGEGWWRRGAVHRAVPIGPCKGCGERTASMGPCGMANSQSQSQGTATRGACDIL